MLLLGNHSHFSKRKCPRLPATYLRDRYKWLHIFPDGSGRPDLVSATLLCVLSYATVTHTTTADRMTNAERLQQTTDLVWNIFSYAIAGRSELEARDAVCSQKEEAHIQYFEMKNRKSELLGGSLGLAWAKLFWSSLMS